VLRIRCCTRRITTERRTSKRYSVTATTETFCTDCPDRKLCEMGSSCEFVRGVQAMIKYTNEVTRGRVPNTMSENKKTTVTPADVAAKAAEDKLVKPTVPQQAEPATEEKVQDQTTETPDEKGTDDETKAPVEQRLAEQVTKLRGLIKKNRTVVFGLAGTILAAGFAMRKFAKNAAAEVVEETLEPVLPVDEDETVIETA
jgi:hypothetical protein